MQRQEFEAQIAAAHDDADGLLKICDLLMGRSEPWAGRLRIDAMARRIALRKLRPFPTGPSTAASSPAAPDWLTALGIAAPDGRPLYQYRLSKEQFTAAQAELVKRAPAMSFQRKVSDSALFVLWAAEWYRRCYGGGLQRWQDLGDEIGLVLDHAPWRRVADVGLRFWKIPPLRLNGFHLRLSAIARQGGFPVAAFSGDYSGWARQYLERLTGLLLAETDPDLPRADAHAAALDAMIPVTWRHEGMRTVCAELALQIVRLRREAEAGGAVSGSLVSAWLDLNRPGWRNDLPLQVDDGRALVDGLIRAAPIKGGSGSVRATRLLVRERGEWREKVRLGLQGSLREIDQRELAGALSDEWSRLRLYPAGVFARHVSGELAIVEPGDDRDWTARPATSRIEFDLPFDVPVEVELRGEGKRVCGPFLLPHGMRVAEGVRIFLAETVDEDEQPTHLALVGTGSGAFRPQSLFLDLPDNWSVEAEGDDSSCGQLDGEGDVGRHLWDVCGTLRVRSQRGDLYLIRCGQANDRRDSLHLIGQAPRGCASGQPGLQLLVGLPRLELRDSGVARAPAAREAWWRLPGTRDWVPLDRDVTPGHCEFAWLDGKTGHIRDRAEAIVLPEGFEIQRAFVGDSVEFTVAGWDGSVLWDAGRSAASGGWRIPRRGGRRASGGLTLSRPGIDSVALAVPLPHQAWISHWTTGPADRGARLSIATLHQYVARSDHSCELMADLIDGDGRIIDQGQASWWVDGELPLSAIRDDLAALLRPLDDLRAYVRLNFNDGESDHWNVHEFDTVLERSGDRLTPRRTVVEEGVRVVGRPLADPVAEHDDFPAYSFDGGGFRPVQLPPLRGEWLIYLRSQDRVISEPLRVVGSPLAVLPDRPLARAMAIADRWERSDALDRICENIIADPLSKDSQEILRSVVQLAASLDGLRAGTFDILAKTAAHPALGPLLLFQASPSELGAVLRLAEGLPLIWATVSRRFWLAAAEAKFRQLDQLMPDRLADIALVIGERRKAIAALDDTLTPLLELAPPPGVMMDIVQFFLNRSTDRIPSSLDNPFRGELASQLPSWSFPERYWRALDAPIVAARAAAERHQPNLAQIYCIKDVARRHPRYFREAFAAALLET